jgi:hypothetical protein
VLEGEARVLFHQQDRHSAFVEFGDDGEDFPHELRGEPEARFVEQQQARPAHQRPGDGQHLLLSAGEAAGGLVGPFLQPGEAGEGGVDVGLDVVVAARPGAEQQVVADGLAGEYPPPLGRVGDAERNGFRRADAGQVGTVEVDGPLGGFDDAADGPEQGGLACAVGAEQGDHLAGLHLDVDTVEGADPAVAHHQPAHLEEGVAHPSSPK